MPLKTDGLSSIFRSFSLRGVLSLLFLFLFLSLPASLSAQDEGELNRQIRLVKEEIQREQLLRKKEQERDESFQNSAKERLKRLQSERVAASAQTDSLQAELQRVETLRVKQRSTARWYTKRHKDHGSFLAGYVDSLIAFVEIDFPYGKEERLRSLRTLREQLHSGAISPEEGTDRIWASLLSLLKVGNSVENWPGALMTSYGELSGRYLRLGAVFMAFVSDDGREVYLLSHLAKGWEWEPLSEEIEFRAAVREALKVSEGKSAPALVLLPLPIEASPLNNSKGEQRGER